MILTGYVLELFENNFFCDSDTIEFRVNWSLWNKLIGSCLPWSPWKFWCFWLLVLESVFLCKFCSSRCNCTSSCTCCRICFFAYFYLQVQLFFLHEKSFASNSCSSLFPSPNLLWRFYESNIFIANLCNPSINWLNLNLLVHVFTVLQCVNCHW